MSGGDSAGHNHGHDYGGHAGVFEDEVRRIETAQGALLLDMNADSDMAEKVRRSIEIDGDRRADIHLWRIGPGHLSAILSVVTSELRTPVSYCERLGSFHSLSHLTIEVIPRVEASEKSKTPCADRSCRTRISFAPSLSKLKS